MRIPKRGDHCMKSIPQILCLVMLSLLATSRAAQSGKDTAANQTTAEPAGSNYLLGPGDQISVSALELDEISKGPYTLDNGGGVNIPLAGRIHAAGLSVSQLESEIVSKLKTYQLKPQVSVTVVQFRSQPVSIIGAVNTPGVHHLEGTKTLVEALSLAGGLRGDAGSTVKITRRIAQGRIPLPNAVDDQSGGFSVAEVKVKTILDARNPEENINVKPDDVISIPRAEMIYVVGEVEKSGGYTLSDDESITVLQALSLAGGLRSMASPKTATILRHTPGATQRKEEPLDLKRILVGSGKDVQMYADDILFIPTNKSKAVALRTIEAMVNAGTGIAVFRSSR
jgi:polysaccharide export outer membrane protein